MDVEKQTLSKLRELKAGKRMLADSDALAFIYLIENEDSFIYISIGNRHWEKLKQAYDNRLPVILYESGKRLLTLNEFHEELDYLLANIEDNSNYGDEMVSAVATHFQ